MSEGFAKGQPKDSHALSLMLSPMQLRSKECRGAGSVERNRTKCGFYKMDASDEMDSNDSNSLTRMIDFIYLRFLSRLRK